MGGDTKTRACVPVLAVPGIQGSWMEAKPEQKGWGWGWATVPGRMVLTAGSACTPPAAISTTHRWAIANLIFFYPKLKLILGGIISFEP